MKTPIASNTVSVARTSFAIAAFALTSCGADDLTGEQRTVDLARTAPSMSISSAGDPQPCTGHQSHALLLEDSTGKAFRLVHVPGCGWKQVSADSSREDEVAPRQVSLAPISVSHAETTAATSADPLAVYIDGPTGYTFVWTRKDGWKFVGYLRDGAR